MGYGQQTVNVPCPSQIRSRNIQVIKNWCITKLHWRAPYTSKFNLNWHMITNLPWPGTSHYHLAIASIQKTEPHIFFTWTIDKSMAECTPQFRGNRHSIPILKSNAITRSDKREGSLYDSRVWVPIYEYCSKFVKIPELYNLSLSSP